VRQLRVLAAMASAGVFVWSVTMGTAAASAAGRLHSGSHGQAVGRFSHTDPSESLLRGANVTAGIVAVTAVLALLFLVVTLIRRRVRIRVARPV
jgi:hypothetical protein